MSCFIIIYIYFYSRDNIRSSTFITYIIKYSEWITSKTSYHAFARFLKGRIRHVCCYRIFIVHANFFIVIKLQIRGRYLSYAWLMGYLNTPDWTIALRMTHTGKICPPDLIFSSLVRFKYFLCSPFCVLHGVSSTSMWYWSWSFFIRLFSENAY